MFRDVTKNSKQRLTDNIVSISVDVGSIISCCTASSQMLIARNPILLMDYVQFLAAREIQRHWRGFKTRRSLNREWQAANIIQRWWRGYWERKTLFKFVENKIQNLLLSRYNRAATKIQALFRGWKIRQTMHDSKGLVRMQNCAAEDLLNCVAFKLHYMMRTYQIPGVYSLRNSHCLSRVEKLLASTQYRFHNIRVHSDMAYRKNMVERHRKEFKDARFYANAPYKGPNFNSACKPHCKESLYNTKDVDARMFKIISAYEKSQAEPKAKIVYHNLAERKRRHQINQILQRSEREKNNFCADVIASMRRWSIWNGNKITIDKDIFRNLDKLESFLDEAFEILYTYSTCHCKMPVHDIVVCH